MTELSSGRARIDVAPGPRATEAHLLEILRAEAEAVRADPSLCARPVRVLVPSRSLRLHVAERLVAELGAVAGIELQTLFGAAVQILERAGQAAGGGDALVDVLVRRRAAEERVLEEAFGSFTDGFRTVCATVRDLFDAGFEPDLERPLLESLTEAELGRATRERAAAVVRTAARVARDLEGRGLGGRSELLRRAMVAYKEDPDRWPARAIVVHGFADATGCATDLIEALVQAGSARVLLDSPPDPEDLAKPDLGWTFVDRLRERLEGHAPVEKIAASVRAVQPELVRAPGALSEVQAIAVRIQAALDEGVRPERIGVVARDLAPYRVPLRARFSELGIPATALRTRAPIDGIGRRLVALATLCEELDRTPTDRWLDAVGKFERPDRADEETRVPRRAASAELRLGLRVVGAGRLADVTALDPADHLVPDKFHAPGVMKLPVRSGIRRFDSKSDDERELRRSSEYIAPRMSLQGGELEAALRSARSTFRRLKRWSDDPGAREAIGQRILELERLVHKDLGWRANDRAWQRLRQALQPLAEIAAEEVTFGEFVRLVRPVLTRSAEPSFAGQGGGVQVLDAMEARGRTFERLFVLGLNRDVFPRVGREDALVPDDGRRALAHLLPDIPLFARRRLEDRYLFAQLVSAADAVTLSWQTAGDDGKPAVVSPLVERLFGERPEKECVASAPAFWAERAFDDVLRPVRERAVLAGTRSGRTDFVERVRFALTERGRSDAAELAAVRGRLLDAFEGGSREPERLAPWLGFLGAQAEGLARSDPRKEALFVTMFEGLVRCPWQSVLQKVLRIEESPDPLDELPGVERRVLGNVVHAALEELVRRVTGTGEVRLEDAVGREAQKVDWSVAEADELLTRAAREAVAKERAPVPGLIRSYVACARAVFEQAVQWLAREQGRWDAGALGAEVQGYAKVPGSDVSVAFRADLVEARTGEDGERIVVLSDYKTGAPKSAKDYREKGIRTGAQLQPIAYALGAADLGFEARGRFLFAAAEDPDDIPVGLEGDWREHVDEWSDAIGVVVDAWIAGELFPRMNKPDGEKPSDTCKWCSYAPACLRGDSGAKQALVELAMGGKSRPALNALWRLSDSKDRVGREKTR